MNGLLIKDIYIKKEPYGKAEDGDKREIKDAMVPREDSFPEDIKEEAKNKEEEEEIGSSIAIG